MSCQNNFLNQGYTLPEILISMVLISLIATFSLMGLTTWQSHQVFQKDLRETYLSLEFASAEAALGQRVFIVLDNNQLKILQDSNLNNFPDDTDQVIHEIKLESQNLKFSLEAFGENNSWIRLDPQNQDAFQNFTLGFLKNNQALPEKIIMSTAGDIHQ